jgi:hypothetical protein
MIYVLTYPVRWIDKLRYHVRGDLPVVSGDEIRYGPGGVEVIDNQSNSCKIIPYPQVAQIAFDGGYSEAVEKVKSQQKNSIAEQFNNLLPNVTDSAGAEVPYNPSTVEPLKDIRDFQ